MAPIVTGAAPGTGQALTGALAARGHTAVVAGIDADGGQRAGERAGRPGPACCCGFSLATCAHTAPLSWPSAAGPSHLSPRQPEAPAAARAPAPPEGFSSPTPPRAVCIFDTEIAADVTAVNKLAGVPATDIVEAIDLRAATGQPPDRADGSGPRRGTR